MNSFNLGVLIALLGFTACYLYRTVRGPHLFDRLIGLNGIATKAILILVFIGAVTHQLGMFLDISLGYGLLNLVGALAVGKYLEKRGASS